MTQLPVPAFAPGGQSSWPQHWEQPGAGMGGWGGCRAQDSAPPPQWKDPSQRALWRLSGSPSIPYHIPLPTHQDDPNSLCVPSAAQGAKHPILLLHPPDGAWPSKSTPKLGMVWVKRLRSLGRETNSVASLSSPHQGDSQLLPELSKPWRWHCWLLPQI